jgi:hypothetical protein
MKKIPIIAFMILMLSVAPMAQALNNPVLPVNEPIVSNITSTTANVSVPPAMLSTFSSEQLAGIYFEYFETQQVCIMIYPTPENCLPKKTIKGQTTAVLQGLKPSTSYTVSYKSDNTINCIQAPCPGNAIQSGYVEFTTLSSGAVNFSRNLMYRSRGADVTLLQDILREKGYLSVQSTGFFGIATFRAVKAFQKNYMHIPPTGYVGPKTRAVLNSFSISANTEERFEGTIQSVSTACFADGECSVTIDGKKVVTTIGWSQAIVGSIKGTVNSIGDIETSKIGSRASVYAKKTPEGYTLYGNANYYIEVK